VIPKAENEEKYKKEAIKKGLITLGTLIYRDIYTKGALFEQIEPVVLQFLRELIDLRDVALEVLCILYA
jgi:hypothetical protein